MTGGVTVWLVRERLEYENPWQRPRVVAVGITLLVVFFVVIPGLLLILGLGRAADGPAPAPKRTADAANRLPRRTIILKTGPGRSRDSMRKQVARADYN
jgi:hypothetical protein